MTSKLSIDACIKILNNPDYDDDDYIDNAIDAVDTLKFLLTKDIFERYMYIADSDDFWILELFADLIAHFQGVPGLPKLLEMNIKGFEKGHDNDGLQTTIVCLVEDNSVEAEKILNDIINGKYHSMPNAGYIKRNNEKMIKMAKWALTFC